MNATRKVFGEALQLIALCCAFLSVWGWFFWLSMLGSDVTLAQLRADPEFDSMLAIADALAYCAPAALVIGLAALRSRPKYVPYIAIVLGIVGTIWLAVGI